MRIMRAIFGGRNREGELIVSRGASESASFFQGARGLSADEVDSVLASGMARSG